LNILALNIHGKTEHIGRNLNVKIVTRLLILVKIMKFHMRAKHIRPAVLLVTDAVTSYMKFELITLCKWFSTTISRNFAGGTGEA